MTLGLLLFQAILKVPLLESKLRINWLKSQGCVEGSSVWIKHRTLLKVTVNQGKSRPHKSWKGTVTEDL